MKKINFVFVLVIAFTLFVCVSGVVSATIYVPDNHAKIQWAVNNASAGDTIIIRDGHYVENVGVDKSLTIQSENGSDSTIVQAENPKYQVFYVNKDYVTIKGLTIKGANVLSGTYGRASGIYFHGVDYCNISENNISDNYFGAYLLDSSDYIKIYNNTFLNNTRDIEAKYSVHNEIIRNNFSGRKELGHYGIMLIYASFGIIHDNYFSKHGICLSGSRGNIIANNTFSDSGLRVSHFSTLPNNIVVNNTVNDKPLVYLEGASDYIVEKAGQVVAINSNNVTIKGLDLSYTEAGVCFSDTDNSVIINTNLNNNIYGIVLSYSDDNIITNNNMSNNQEQGIFVGLSYRNKIYLNNFIDNSENFYASASVNIWNSTSKITYTYNGSTYTNYLGNYWDDYTDVDADNDGIWDHPRPIDARKDYHPLVDACENYEEKWSFAIITDIHLGYGIPDYGTGDWLDTLKGEEDNYYLTKRLEKVVDRIIDLSDDYNIKFVAVLGDIGDTAEKSEFLKAKQILDKLNDADIPYVPLIGNHDVWPYTQNASWIPDDRGNSVEETASSACGEIFFEEVFWNRSNNRNLELIEELFGNSWNRQEELPGYAGYPYLQNYAFRHGGIQFICLDYNWKVPPGDWRGSFACFHEETLKWLTEYSEDAHFRNEEVITSLHYPIPGLGKGLSFGGHVHSRWADDNTKWTWLPNMIITEALLEESENVIRIVQVNGKNINYETLEGIPKTDNISEDASEYPFFVCPSFILKHGSTPFTAYGKKLDGANITSWDWDFGDGETDSGKEVIHTYDDFGDHIVTLTVTNTGGEKKEIRGEVKVLVPVKALLAEGLSAFSLRTGEDVTITPQNTPQWVKITKRTSESKPVADLLVHFENATSDIDLSTITADVNITERMSIIYMPSWPNEIEESKLLYIPSTGKGAVYICKNATSLDEVSIENADVVINVGETKDGMTVLTTFYNDTEYYVIFNVTGTGGGEFAPTDFDTEAPANPYPSISGTHNGTIMPNQTITVSKLYTYPCSGTGGHTESIELNKNGIPIASGTWNGYQGDWHNITIHNLTGGAPYVTLLKDHKYNYTIRTGSYPQIIHETPFNATGGTIACTEFTDENGKVYKDWIPAIKLFLEEG